MNLNEPRKRALRVMIRAHFILSDMVIANSFLTKLTKKIGVPKDFKKV